MRVLLNGCLRYSLLILFGGTVTIGGCAQSAPVDMSSKTQIINDPTSVQDLRHYFESLKLVDLDTVQGNTQEERLKSQDWLYQNYAETLGAIGISKDKLLKVAGNDAEVAKLVRRYVLGEARFKDYLQLSEIAVIARVGDAVSNSPMTFAGPAFFDLNVSDNLLDFSESDNIVVINAFSPHMRPLKTGQECVFFLSPTRTQNINLRDPIIPDLLAANYQTIF